jgi:MarR family transcriptional regulator, organic hydroperoxide resistance regulator
MGAHRNRKFVLKIFDLKRHAGHTRAVSSGNLDLSGGGQPDQAPPPDGAPCGPLNPDAVHWDWPKDVERFPEDAPLQALLLTATKLMGAYGQCTVQAAGLKVSLAGLGVLRLLMDEDGLKSSEVADRAWSSPGTVTAVVNTLARDGFVERKPDEADRRIVRLYLTDRGRAVVTYYVTQAAPQWRKAFDFADEADEAVVRRFFVQMIGHLGRLMREERGR